MTALQRRELIDAAMAKACQGAGLPLLPFRQSQLNRVQAIRAAIQEAVDQAIEGQAVQARR